MPSCDGRSDQPTSVNHHHSWDRCGLDVRRTTIITLWAQARLLKCGVVLEINELHANEEHCSEIRPEVVAEMMYVDAKI